MQLYRLAFEQSLGVWLSDFAIRCSFAYVEFAYEAAAAVDCYSTHTAANLAYDTLYIDVCNAMIQCVCSCYAICICRYAAFACSFGFAHFLKGCSLLQWGRMLV